MKASLEAERNIEEGEKKALSFDEVREYLKKRTTKLILKIKCHVYKMDK